MPRKPRIEYKEGLYHIINRGNRRATIFHRDEDYEKFIECIETTRKRHPFICYCYTLMPNHFHLLIEMLNDPVHQIMKSSAITHAIKRIREKGDKRIEKIIKGLE